MFVFLAKCESHMHRNKNLPTTFALAVLTGFLAPQRNNIGCRVWNCLTQIHNCLRQVASPTTPALVTKTNSKCWRLDSRNSNRHQTPQHRKSLCLGQNFWAKTQLFRCSTLGRVTCKGLHFLVQDHRNSFDARRQCPCKGTLHGVISQVGSNVPLVVCLGTILWNTISLTHLVIMCFFFGRVSNGATAE